MVRTILSGLRALLRREAFDREIADEIDHYLAMSTEEHIRRGLAPEAAARAARAEMGTLTATRERVRSGGWEARAESAWRDARYALRGLRRHPGFAAIVIATLALGTGANTVMFSVVNTVMLRPLPYHDAARIVLLWTDDVRRGLHREATAYATIADWRERNRSFADVAFFGTRRVALLTNNPPGRGRARNALVSGNLFDLLGARPLMGRAISADDESSQAAVVVISHAFWQRAFPGDANVVGKTVTIDDAAKSGPVSFTVIGVMPADFYFPDKVTDFWTPATTYWSFARESSERFPDWARRWIAVARLAPGVRVDGARADMARLAGELAAMHPGGAPDFPGFATTVTPVLDTIAGADLQQALWILLGATALVLLVACANVANLLLARGAARQHEFAIRRALGGGRGRLLRQLAIEHAVLAVLGGAAGLLIAPWGMRVLKSAAADFIPRLDELTIDPRVLAAATAAALLSAFVFGLAPALRLSATEASETLKGGLRATGSRRLRRTRGAMVLAECALAIMLLTGAGLLLRSLGQLLSIDPGFDPRGVLTVRIELPREAPAALEQQLQVLLGSIQAMPGVEAAGFIDDLFVAGQGRQTITIPARASGEVTGELNNGWVTPGFFTALRVPLRRGRYLTHEDARQKIRALQTPTLPQLSLAEKMRRAVPEPVVVNEAFAQRFFPGVDPVGQRFCIDPANKTYWYEVVGVVGAMHRQGLERRTIPEYFGPYLPAPNGRTDLLVRSAGDPLAFARTVRSAVAASLPSAVVVDVSTAAAQLSGFSARRELQTGLLSAFAFLALALAAIGVFGVVHYMVAERTREFGVRMALGATRRNILSLVLLEGMRLPLAGIVIGLAASAGITQVMSSLLFGIRPTDPLTFISGAALLAGTAAAACFIAARRGSRVEPLQALRE